MIESYEKIMKGISNGFGCGHICAALVSSIMAMGLVCPAGEIASLRMELLERFYAEYETLTCSELKSKDECKNIVAKIAAILDEIISKRL